MLEDILTQKRTAILERWTNLIAGTHLAGADFLKGKDRFTNPVGYVISTELPVLYDELLQGLTNSEKISISLGNVVKIRAVQDFSPSQVVSFVFLLKRAIRDELGSEFREKQTLKELLEFDSRVDDLALLTFDAYVACREKIQGIRVNEIKADRDNAFRLLERAFVKYEEIEGWGPRSHKSSEVSE